MTTSVRARRTDPATSHEAGASQTGDRVRASHARVLAMFRTWGDMDDKALEAMLNDACRATGFPMMSPSGVRSRRSELSKPNMDRLEQLRAEELKYHPERDEKVREMNARFALRREGFRSPLWDTGKRVEINGHKCIVWGLAK